MKNIICAVFSLLVIIAISGCDLLTSQKTAIYSAIIKYVETKGTPAAEEYINKLVSEGKISEENAKKLKAAIPLGVDKVKEVMNNMENKNE